MTKSGNMQNNQIEVKILAGSVTEDGAKITTFELLYHRFFHSEFMTHKVISKNAASSRAIPTIKLLDLVQKQPMLPISVGKNRSGMQADEDLEEEISNKFMEMWKDLGVKVATDVKIMQELGAHKQIVNRPLEAWLPIRVVATATDWDNFFELRDSQYAQPEFGLLARLMKEAITNYEYTLVKDNEWHLPYITIDDVHYVSNNTIYKDIKWETLCALSAGRSARVSHALGGLSTKTIDEEIAKGKELCAVEHMSPFEHQATPWNVTRKAALSSKSNFDKLLELTQWLSTPNSTAPTWADVRNLRGWRPLRSFIEHNEFIIY